jgi:predicted  nucleic acid-binding Zn-ribbon protein
MASSELRRLWKLHQIDSAIQVLRNRAAHLDVGKSIAKEIEELTAKVAAHPGKILQTEQRDLELQQQGLDAKLEKIDKELYGGKVVNPREVEAYQKEIQILKKQREGIDERLLAIWDQLPALVGELEKVQKTLDEKKVELQLKQRESMNARSNIEAEFKGLTAQRPEVAKDQNPAMLVKYEAIRKNHHGIGMAEVVKKRQCGACGTLLPERTLQACLDDKTVTCETCHRILYYTEGVI